MKSLNEFLYEKTGKMEIPTTKAKQYATDMKKLGIKVEVADDDGVVVSGDMDKIHKYLKSQGWGTQDIKDLHA